MEVNNEIDFYPHDGSMLVRDVCESVCVNLSKKDAAFLAALLLAYAGSPDE